MTMDYYVPPTGFKSVFLKLRGNWTGLGRDRDAVRRVDHRGFRSPDRAL